MADIAKEGDRPSPEALLETAKQEGRGRLKLFLGAAPGVGKTYEMLCDARARKREGVDVVVGLVETHGRPETELLLEGLEVIPRRVVDYKGHALAEMDLDAILDRHPALVLVDELAHTNAPGSRHEKRYLDVEELLAAGIDIYTTLNIQHLESLGDVIAQITRIRVRETVPDSIIDRADEIEVVDLTPEDLIQRLKEGKVYVPQQARRAIQHYFSPGNLTALRELALRRTAQRVDAQMLNYMRSHAIRGPWAAGERVLVCVDGGPDSSALVRHARRFADQLNAPWTAIHVEGAEGRRRTEVEQDRIAEALRLAERLGGAAVTIPGPDVVETLVDYARANNVTHVVIARARRGFLRGWWRGSVEKRLIRRASDLAIHLMPAATERRGERGPLVSPREALKLHAYAGSAAIVILALLVGLLMRHVAAADVALVFLTAVLASAITYGLWPSLFTCLLSVLAYNFFFLRPLYTFTAANPENVIAVSFFVVVALFASQLGARVRAQAITARRRAKTTEELYQFSRKLAAAAVLDDVLWATAHQIALMLKVRVVLLLPEDERLQVRAGYPPEDILGEADLAAATWSWQRARPAGRGADTLPGAKWLFLPMRTGRGTVGVAGIDRDAPAALNSEERRLLNALTDQAALAIERVKLAEDLDRERLSAENDRVRAVLFNSISQDLKAPLASIMGAATTLAAQDDSLEQKPRSALIRTVQDQAERLNRFIGNLLDMTRLETGRMSPAIALKEPSEVVGAALARAEKVLAAHRVRVDLPRDPPLLAIDASLFEQVLFNLLDNAAKRAPPGTEIALSARRQNGRVRIEVMDEGKVIAPSDLARVFDKFSRGFDPERRAGTGLGLAVSRGFVEAMGGRLEAANRTDRAGAVFTVDLPAPEVAELPAAIAP